MGFCVDPDDTKLGLQVETRGSSFRINNRGEFHNEELYITNEATPFDRAFDKLISKLKDKAGKAYKSGNDKKAKRYRDEFVGIVEEMKEELEETHEDLYGENWRFKGTVEITYDLLMKLIQIPEDDYLVDKMDLKKRLEELEEDEEDE
jgi:hypothetical protein